MQRRDVLKMITLGAALPASVRSLCHAAGAHPASGYTLQTLNAHQNDTLVVMTELIIPATETPGAKATNVNEFIDVVLTGWATAGERAHFLSGLADVDQRTNLLFSKDFIG